MNTIFYIDVIYDIHIYIYKHIKYTKTKTSQKWEWTGDLNMLFKKDKIQMSYKHVEKMSNFFSYQGSLITK